MWLNEGFWGQKRVLEQSPDEGAGDEIPPKRSITVQILALIVACRIYLWLNFNDTDGAIIIATTVGTWLKTWGCVHGPSLKPPSCLTIGCCLVVGLDLQCCVKIQFIQRFVNQ